MLELCLRGDLLGPERQLLESLQDPQINWLPQTICSDLSIKSCMLAICNLKANPRERPVQRGEKKSRQILWRLLWNLRVKRSQIVEESSLLTIESKGKDNRLFNEELVVKKLVEIIREALVRRAYPMKVIWVISLLPNFWNVSNK